MRQWWDRPAFLNTRQVRIAPSNNFTRFKKTSGVRPRKGVPQSRQKLATGLFLVVLHLGHGGTEALILGVLAGMAFASMLAYRAMDLSTVPGIAADQVELAKQQVAAYWAAPPYLPLLGFAERIFAMCLHVSLSVMVMLALAARKPVWFWVALFWHALVDAVAVFAVQQIGAVGVEGVIAVFALISMAAVFALRSMFPAETVDAPVEPSVTA